MNWNVYLSGESHSPWHREIVTATQQADLPVTNFGPVTEHEASDNCGPTILGAKQNVFWRDQKAAKVNAI